VRNIKLSIIKNDQKDDPEFWEIFRIIAWIEEEQIEEYKSMHEEDKKLKKQKENNDYKKDCCSKKNKKHLKHLKEKDHYKKLSIQEELEKRQAA